MNKITRENISLPRAIAFKDDLIQPMTELVRLEQEVTDLETLVDGLMNKGGSFDWNTLTGIPKATTDTPGIVELSNATDSESVTTAATLKAVSDVFKTGFVPKTRKINGQTLDKDVTLTMQDLGGMSNADVDELVNQLVPQGYVLKTTTVNGVPLSTDAVTIPATGLNGVSQKDIDDSFPFVDTSTPPVEMTPLDPAKFTIHGRRLHDGFSLAPTDLGAYSTLKEYTDAWHTDCVQGFLDYRKTLTTAKSAVLWSTWDPTTRNIDVTMTTISALDKSRIAAEVQKNIGTSYVTGLRFGSKLAVTDGSISREGNVITGVWMVGGKAQYYTRPLMVEITNLDGTTSWVAFNA